MEILKILIIPTLGAFGLWVIYLLFKNWQRLVAFIRDVKTEMKKVSWSTKKELVNSTWIVIISVFLLTLFIGIVDFMVSRVINLLIR